MMMLRFHYFSKVLYVFASRVAEATGGATINGLAIGGLLPGDCSQNLAAAILL